ncbi:MAG: 50S ribosomal protein L29 [Elusimicrobia bacterium RIFCSPLOWO2_01_FULL_54_10]|nr:MAG: 50S ribosomal protein L29 [Elusimicrobia bacterium RIFCSPLOWO2_01_FULL_54_10]
MQFKGQDRAAVRQLPEKELQAQLKETEEKLFKLKFSNSITPLKNGHEIAHLRKHRARLLTWIRQKNIKGAARA